MNQTLDSALTEAYTLIEDDNPDQAKTLLEPYLSEHPDDPDLWWVYLHALDDPNEAQQALEKVLELDPNYPGAESLATELEMDTRELPVAEEKPSLKRLRTSQPAPPTLPDDSSGFAGAPEDFEDDFDTFEEPSNSRSNILVPILSVIGVLAVLIGALFAFQLFTGSDGDEPTQVAQGVTDATETPALGAANVTDAPTATLIETSATATVAVSPTDTAEESESTDEVVATEETDETADDAEATEDPSPVGTTDAATEEATAGESETESATNTPTDEPIATDEPDPTDTPPPTETPTNEPTATATVTASPAPTETPSLEDQISAAFEGFDLYDEALSTLVDTEQGETFLVTVCLNPGDSRNTVLSDAMVTLANSEISYPDGVNLAGIDLFNCEAEQRVRAVAVPLGDMNNFAEGNIERDQFQLAWRPVR